MAKRQIGKCRFYADIPQYLKVLGYYSGVRTYSVWENNEILIGAEIAQYQNVWNMNPSQVTTFDEAVAGQVRSDFWINADPALYGDAGGQLALPQNPELSQLLTNISSSSSTGLYGGALGHNSGDFEGAGFGVHLSGLANTDNGVTVEGADASYTEIVNAPPDVGTDGDGIVSPTYNGYSLFDITSFDVGLDHVFKLSFWYDLIDGTAYAGAFTYGRWFEPEHSFDIKATIDHSYDGVKLQNTIGGSTLSNISYLGQNNWGNLPAWTLEKQEGHDYNIGANRARRSWKVGLSYLTDDNLFDKAGNENKFFTWTDQADGEDGDPEYVFDSSLSSFFKLSLMGKLPFIFCPDSSADDLEFALCRITNKPSFKQVANNLFSTSLVITETY